MYMIDFIIVKQKFLNFQIVAKVEKHIFQLASMCNENSQTLD